MSEEITVRPVGTVTGGRDEWIEDNWYGVKSVIRLDAEQFDPGVVLGLADSHLEVVFYFDRIDPSAVRTEPRPARGNPAWPAVGVFAGHGPFRPNLLGVSRCRLLAVEGLDLQVADLHALDGTPVLDVRPYLAEFAPRDPVKAYVLAAIEHATRRIRILGATTHPGGGWIVQQARNLVMDLEDTRARIKFVLHDRDGTFHEVFDAVFEAAGMRIVRSGVRMPRMNSIMERWIGGCRRELLDRTLI